MDISPRAQDGHTYPLEQGEKSRQYKGIRQRKWGKWVSEVRIPKSRDKIWLGSYSTAEQAARAYDAAVFCLRGPHWQFNFPNSIPAIPSASSLSRRQIQLAAAKHAAGEIPETKSVSTEEVASPSRTEMEASSDSQMQSAWWEWDDNSRLGFEEFPSFDWTVTDVLAPLDAPGSIFFDPTDLWSL